MQAHLLPPPACSPLRELLVPMHAARGDSVGIQCCEARQALGAVMRARRGPRRRRLSLALVVAVAAQALTGCAGYYYGEEYGPTLGSLSSPTGDLLGSSLRAADLLLQAAPWMAGAPVRVAALVNADAPAVPSRLGRVVAEQIAGRLVQRGVPVAEPPRLPVMTAPLSAPPMQPVQGLVPLPPLQPLQPLQQVVVVNELPRVEAPLPIVVGSYTVSAQKVFISVKLLRSDGTTAIAAHDYALPLGKDVRSLLSNP